MRRPQSTADRQNSASEQETEGDKSSTVPDASREPGPLHAGDTAVAIQPKLTVNEPDDEYEKEAERVTDAVMRMLEPEATADVRGSVPSDRVQRMCPRCRRRYREGKPLDCSECEQGLQRKPETDGVPVAEGVEQASAVARKAGKPLSDNTRSFFEGWMGRDFGEVRVHTGPKADRAARSIDAQAFTLGKDVVFRSGEYRPNEREGKQLLAHELTHVVQQARAQDSGTLRRQQGNQETSGSESESEEGGPLGKIPDEYKEAAERTLKAALKTEFGQDLKERGLSALEEYWQTTPGKITLPLAGLGTLILTNGPFPVSAPSIPMDELFPNDDLRGLSVNVHLHGLPTSGASIPYVGEKVKAGVSIDDPFPLSLSGSIQGRKAPGVDYQFMIQFDPVELTRELKKKKEK